MSSEQPPEPAITEAARVARDERRARLAQAMRANLQRRKAQARGRAALSPAADEPGHG